MNAQAAAEAEAEQDDVLISPEDLILNGRYRILRGALLLSYGTSATEAFRVEDDQQGSLDLFALVGDQTLPPRSDEIALLTGFMHRHVMRLVDAGTVPNSGPGSAHHPIILEFPAGGHVMPPQGASAMVENEVKRRIMGPVLMLLTFAGVLAASLEFPTFIILACGMPPALVAALVDDRSGRHASICVLAASMVGIVPILISLWLGGNSIVTDMTLMSDVYVWFGMYGAAAMGWMLVWACPVVTEIALMISATLRINKLRSYQKGLVEEWGDPVAS